jgi:hypothetical protein
MIHLSRARPGGAWNAGSYLQQVVSRIFRTFGFAERRPALAYAVMAPLI